MPKYLDSIIFTICIYTHLQQGMLLAMGTITVDIFAPPIGYWHRRRNRFDEWRKGLWTNTSTWTAIGFSFIQPIR
jgi:hypothetical protein